MGKKILIKLLEIVKIKYEIKILNNWDEMQLHLDGSLDHIEHVSFMK